MPLKTVLTTEGKARLRIPALSAKDPFHQLAFFNPRMSFNRSLSTLALAACLHAGYRTEDAVLCDGLCGVGARGVRYALEGEGVNKVFFVDANPAAVQLAKKNVALNGLKKKSVVAEDDLNAFFLQHQNEFDFVEIDPFGSPTPFLENAFRALKHSAILSVTATDLATSGGSKPQPARRHYDAHPLRCEYSHEIAARILVGRIARTAASLDFGVKPLVTFYKEHFVKTLVFCEKSAEKANASLASLGVINHCFSCLNRVVAKNAVEKCGECGALFQQAGPLWSSRVSDAVLLDSMLSLARKADYLKENERGELIKFVELLVGENDSPPTFFDLHVLSKKLHAECPKKSEVVKALAARGFHVTETHYEGTAIKTNASARTLSEIVLSLV
jgi:tRNA (guanine26-N2/guanine27-N2)-dimethyltransferase